MQRCELNQCVRKKGYAIAMNRRRQPGRGSGFRVQGSRFKVQGSRFRAQGSRFRAQGSRFEVQGSDVRGITLKLSVHARTEVNSEPGTLNLEPLVALLERPASV